MPVLPDVGSRMIESSLSRPRASRSSTRYFATRSLTEPVGFVTSSFAKIRTDGQRRHPRDRDERRVADRVEDVVVPPAVRRKLLVGVDVNVVRVDRLGGGGGDPAELARPEGAHRQPAPPAIAGSSRTSSRSPTGVSSPSR